MKRYVLILIAIVYGIFPLFSQIINVPSDQPNIQAGIDSASNGDTVLVAEGTYLENINFKGKAISVVSQFLMDGDTSHISRTIIDGSQPVHPDTASTILMISGEDSTSVLCGFTITGGTGTIIDTRTIPPAYSKVQAGGGILILDGGCKIEHNIIRDIHMEFTEYTYGGGISCHFGSNERTDKKSIIIQNNSIIGNHLVTTKDAVGAGIYIWVGSTVSDYTGNIVIQDNVISHNNSAAGGTSMAGGIGIGMFVPTMIGEFAIRNNVITHNNAHKGKYNHGGGIYVYYLSSAADPNPSPLIYNNIIADNYCQNEGGGIGVYAFGNLQKPEISPKPVLINNTLVNNSAQPGPGLWANTKARPLLLNNIFWDAPSPSNKDLIGMNSEYFKYNIIRDYNDQSGGSNLNYDPMFTGDSFELSEGSPGIGTGIDSIEISGEWYYAPSLDFYGNPRPHPIDNRVDMGAIESTYEGFVFIPDTAFLYALIDEGVDTNGDSLISYTEAETVINLDVSGEAGESFSGMLFCSKVGEIKSLKGIEAFTNLDTLFCECNIIENLDLSSNTALTYLECGGNLLNSLDVSNHTALTYLHCGGDPATSTLAGLDISGCTALKGLQCVGNQLTSLDVSDCTALEWLRCNRNQLTSLDVSNNTGLSWLECFLNQLTSLDVSGCTALEYLHFGGNQLVSLDVSNNTSLNSLWCWENQLTELDVSANIDLTGLYLGTMPSLHEVCVWESFPNGVEVETLGSPNVYFTTECSGSTGIENDCQPGFSVYPNPTYDLLTIETMQHGQYSIEITSLNGQLIFSGKTEGTSYQIDLSPFRKGVYFITIKAKDFVTTMKIIKL